MMFCSIKGFLVMSGFFLGLAYYFHTPFPAHASNPVFKSIFGFFFRSVKILGQVGNFLGIDNEVNITRAMFSLGGTVGGSENVEVTAEIMEGIRVLIFRPKDQAEGLRPGIVYYHGGGWVILNPDAYAPLCRDISDATKSIVVSVDYRLAPEHLFPAAIEDTIRVTRYFLRNAKQYGVDPDRIGVAGDSAGGNLAMATALNLTSDVEPDLPKIKLQCLIYPALQMFDFNLPSYVTHGDGPGFLRKHPMIDYVLFYLFGNTSRYEAFAGNQHTSAAMKASKQASYVSHELLPEWIQQEVTSKERKDFGNEILSAELKNTVLNPLLSPLMAPDEQLAKLPKTYIIIPEFDVLRDDGFLAEARLRRNNVGVTVDYLRSEEHGFLSVVALSSAQQAIKRFAKFYTETINA